MFTLELVKPGMIHALWWNCVKDSHNIQGYGMRFEMQARSCFFFSTNCLREENVELHWSRVSMIFLEWSVSEVVIFALPISIYKNV